MRSGSSPPSWFARLRRDRGLFAVVGALMVVLGLLQPAAAAPATGLGDLSILCSGHGAPTQSIPGQEPGCPLCPTGHQCAQIASLGIPAQTMAPAFSLQCLGQLLPMRRADRLQPPGSGAPASIRAPPLSE